jgi:hypothetical protein
LGIDINQKYLFFLFVLFIQINMQKMSSTEFIVTIVMGVLLIMAALYFGTADLQPFEGTNKGLIAYPYEGFADAQAAFDKRNPTANAALAPASAAPASAAPASEPFEQMTKKTEEKPKVEGFAGLMGTALGETNMPFSFLANNQGSYTCPSYGITKSTGNVCMSAADMQMLTTRGGNATGM